MTEPLYTTDCRNGHHDRLCGMTPCDCGCHGNVPTGRRKRMKRMTVHLNMPADLALPLLGLIGFLIGTALDGDGIYDGWTGAIGFMGGQFVLLGILWMRRDRRADAADGPMSA